MARSERIILHVDMDAFYASVEQHDRPELRGLPVIVGSPPDRRGVVAACSYEARRFGVHSAMPSRTAFQRCPRAVFLPVRMERYLEVSRLVMQLLESFTPLVEPISIDEAFLDVTGSVALFGPGPEMARRIKRRVRRDTGLTCSVGVAPNKFLAKLASERHKPDGLTVVPRDPEGLRTFLDPLPVHGMWGVGKITREKLEQAGIRTFRDLRDVPAVTLARIVGPAAALSFRQRAEGEDERAVAEPATEKTISREITFETDIIDPQVLRAVLLDLAEDVGRRLRLAGRFAGRAQLKLRWADFQTLTRRQTLVPPCRDDARLRAVALALFMRARANQAVRLIGFGVGALAGSVRTEDRQLRLFAPDEVEGAGARLDRVSQTVDALREQFGKDSVRRGSSLADPNGPR